MEPVFRVLGPVTVTGSRGVLTISAARESAIISQLALNANRVVSVGWLVEAVWEYAAPATAKTQIQICISRLRRSLDDIGLTGRIDTVVPGYRLVAHENEVDVLLFERQVSSALQVIRQRSGRGPVTDAVASARRALGLFAAGPLLDVAGEGAQTMARQLSERRLHVLEECLEAQLDLGQAADVIGELARLVVEHPLRGRLQVLHMKALQQLGRRADALNAYQAARRAYGKHLGVEPDSELRSLYEAILRDLRRPAATAGGTADPDPCARTPRRRPPGTHHEALRRPALGQHLLPAPEPLHLVTRPAEFSGLRTWLAGHESSPLMSAGPRIVSISGMRGVGKTGFAVSAAHELADHYPGGRLFADLRAADGSPVTALQVSVKFLVALGVPRALVPSDPEECAALLLRLLHGRRVLMVLDNARDADQVAPFVFGGSDCGLIVTSRLPLDVRHQVQRIRLDPLDSEASSVFLARLIGEDRIAAEPEHARELARLCAGLPLALTLVAERLNERTCWSLADCVRYFGEESTRLDRLSEERVDIRGVVRADYEEVTDTAQRLLRRLSLREVQDLRGFRDFSSSAADRVLGGERGVSGEFLDELAAMRKCDAPCGGRGECRNKLETRLLRVCTC